MNGKPKICKAWKFQSSNGHTLYETLLYMDSTTSCDCPGWTRRSERSCKHTRAIELGTADDECVSSHSYMGELQVTAIRPAKHTFSAVVLPKVIAGGQPSAATAEPPRARKIRFDDEEPITNEKNTQTKQGKTGKSQRSAR